MYKGKEVDFEVRSIGKPKENEKQKHFIFYLHKDAKQQADWVHLDLKKSAYTSYEKNGHEVLDKILSVMFLDFLSNKIFNRKIKRKQNIFV